VDFILVRLLAWFLLWVGLHASALGQEARAAPASGLAPQRPGVVDAYIVSLGLWGTESVFESEAKGAAQILAQRLDAKGRTLVRVNTKRRSGATPDLIAKAIQDVKAVLDPAEDVLVLVLTSHGSPDGIGLVTGRVRRLVTPADVRRLLDSSGARYRILIVSACYSGIFTQPLADENTLVITAAAADRPSFGCQDGRTWTYFGDAFFNRALRAEPRIDRAFARAKTLVTARERREGFEPSDPQIAGGRAVLERLSRSAPRRPSRRSASAIAAGVSGLRRNRHGQPGCGNRAPVSSGLRPGR
jgi:hypothetical protein